MFQINLFNESSQFNEMFNHGNFRDSVMKLNFGHFAFVALSLLALLTAYTDSPIKSAYSQYLTVSMLPPE